MTKYYKVTGMLTEDEYKFVQLVSELMNCSLARAIGVCVIWARQNLNFRNLLKTLEEARKKEGEKEQRSS
jgi:hypothetical protein